MSKKPPTKRKQSKTENDYLITLTRKRLVLWLAIGFLSLTWMFTLGVFVGRGLSPVHFDLANINRELAELKRELLNRRHVRFKIDTNDFPEKPEFDFYKALTEKKETARLRYIQHSQAKKETIALQSTKIPEEKKGTKAVAAEKSKVRPEDRGRFTIQVAAFQNLKTANDMVLRLKNKGFDVYLTPIHLPEKGTWYRIRVGRFKDRNHAKQVADRLRLYNLEGIIIHQ
nr:SPOR domain-containing protein [Desulfobacterales bacterium]